MSDTPAPAAIVRAIIEAREAGDLDACLAYIAPESLDQGQRVTREDWRRKWEAMAAGCPDMQVTTEHTIENGDWVAHRYTIRGTHTGDFFGAPPTGKRFEVGGFDMVRVHDGRLVEHWAVAEPLA
ncbi:ester cyclase [Yinghuangia soli]|uniref:Ester cyclase n=1 Tax=Yinghuangia soli TaxID=2908204 RepID=A0AA41Q8U0_9ACTN|nr:ester cyclase [Yinghuangia soli]MCF2533558.1 ester cyclase [Yinghuangia soli]